MKNPTTDGIIGFKGKEWDRFREVRHKAFREYLWRKKKPSRGRLPRFKLGERVVLGDNYRGNHRQYVLVEILDFDIHSWSEDYFGIILKTTKPQHDRLYRLIRFSSGGYSFSWHPANVPETSIKWWEEPKDGKNDIFD